MTAIPEENEDSLSENVVPEDNFFMKKANSPEGEELPTQVTMHSSRVSKNYEWLQDYVCCVVRKCLV